MLAVLDNSVAAVVVASADIVVAAEHGDRHVVVQGKAYDLGVPAEVNIEVVVAMGPGLAAAVLALDYIHSALHSAYLPHYVVDSHLVVAFEEEAFASHLASPKLVSPSFAFANSCHWKGGL